MVAESRTQWSAVSVVFIVLGILLLAVLLWSAIDGVNSGRLAQTDLRLLDAGQAFDGVGPELNAERKAAEDAARSKFQRRLASANSLRRVGGVLEWVAIVVTGALTIVAGVNGRIISVRESMDEAELKAALAELGKGKRRLAIFAGVLASIAAVTTLIGTEADAQGHAARDQAKAMHAEFHEARDIMLEAKTESEFRRGLSKLEAISFE